MKARKFLRELLFLGLQKGASITEVFPDAQGFRLCGGDQRAMKTDEVCDRPLETFGVHTHVS